jgi:hypothetical protein
MLSCSLTRFAPPHTHYPPSISVWLSAVSLCCRLLSSHSTESTLRCLRSHSALRCLLSVVLLSKLALVPTLCPRVSHSIFPQVQLNITNYVNVSDSSTKLNFIYFSCLSVFVVLHFVLCHMLVVTPLLSLPWAQSILLFSSFLKSQHTTQE